MWLGNKKINEIEVNDELENNLEKKRMKFIWMKFIITIDLYFQ